MRGTRLLAGWVVAASLSACGGSALGGVVDSLPAEVAGFPLADRSLAGDGRLAAALRDEGLEANAVTGHEARWGDGVRLVILRFEDVGLNEASRVARALLGIGDVDSQLALLGNQTLFELTGPDIGGVAFQYTLSGQGGENLMYTVVAPTAEDAEGIVRAIGEASPSQD